MSSNVYSFWEAGRDIDESTGMIRFEIARRLINAHLARVNDASALLLVDPDHLKLSCYHLTHQLIDTEYLQPLRVLLRAWTQTETLSCLHVFGLLPEQARLLPAKESPAMGVRE